MVPSVSHSFTVLRQRKILKGGPWAGAFQMRKSMQNKSLQQENITWNYKLMVQNFLDVLPLSLTTVKVYGIRDEAATFGETTTATPDKPCVRSSLLFRMGHSWSELEGVLEMM